MNKSIPIFILLLFVSIGTYSQSYIGVFGGINNSKLSGDAPVDAKYKSLIGLNAGAQFDLKLSKATAISLQPSFSQEGVKLFYNVPTSAELVDSLSLRLNYFALPILFKITSTNQKFYAIAGVETAYLMSKDLKSKDASQDLDIDIQEMNVSLQFGAGLRIPLGYPRLFIEVRYTQGLVNITDDPLKNNVLPRVKSSGLKALAGIEIPLTNPKK